MRKFILLAVMLFTSLISLSAGLRLAFAQVGGTKSSDYFAMNSRLPDYPDVCGLRPLLRLALPLTPAIKNCKARAARAKIAYFQPSMKAHKRMVAAVSRAPEWKGSVDPLWVVLASRQDLDQAIAVARGNSEAKPMVVRSSNGWYAVVEGPLAIEKGTERARLDALIGSQGIPKDAFFSAGATFLETMWKTPSSPSLAKIEFDGKQDATLDWKQFHITLSKVPVDNSDGQGPTVQAFYKGAPAFSFEIDDNPNEEPRSKIDLMRLDKTSNAPQAVFTYFTQGAHCCTITRIVTMQNGGSWKVVDGGSLDGDGYDFEDLDGSGTTDLISHNNAFNYKFDTYADSIAPLMIQRLVGDNLVDVTAQPAFRPRLLQELYLTENDLTDGDDRWHSNGFLAGWVAMKMQVGQGVEAWTKMLQTYDKNSDFGPETCTTDEPIENCPDNKKLRVPFPIALKQLLIEQEYIKSPNLYPVPNNTLQAEPQSPEVAPTTSSLLMRTCVQGGDTVRQLVFQTFVGRRLREDESYDDVSLQNDTTVEGNQPNIDMVICAVTYDVDLKSIIGHLAQSGDIERAGSYGRKLVTA